MIENARLSPQQNEIMTYALTGAYNREIAETLGIAKGAVDTQVWRISKKYGTRDKLSTVLVHIGEIARSRT